MHFSKAPAGWRWLVTRCPAEGQSQGMGPAGGVRPGALAKDCHPQSAAIAKVHASHVHTHQPPYHMACCGCHSLANMHSTLGPLAQPSPGFVDGGQVKTYPAEKAICETTWSCMWAWGTTGAKFCESSGNRTIQTPCPRTLKFSSWTLRGQ